MVLCWFLCNANLVGQPLHNVHRGPLLDVQGHCEQVRHHAAPIAPL